jgi:hypothetical protein
MFGRHRGGEEGISMAVSIFLLLVLSQPPATEGNLQSSARRSQDGFGSNFLQRFTLPGVAALEQSGEIAVESSAPGAAARGIRLDAQQSRSRPTCTMLILRSSPAIDPDLVKKADALVDTKMTRPSGCSDERVAR